MSSARREARVEIDLWRGHFGESVTILKRADAGMPVQEICRQAGISQLAYYKCKSKYGGLEPSELRRVKELEAENARLTRWLGAGAAENRLRYSRFLALGAPTHNADLEVIDYPSLELRRSKLH